MNSPGAAEREYVLGKQLRATILTTAEETGGRHDLTECEQPAGVTTPLHLHTRYEERFWVVSGSLTVWAGRDKRTLRSGDYYAIAMHVPHAVRSGPEGVHALHISSPADSPSSSPARAPPLTWPPRTSGSTPTCSRQ